MRHSLNCRKCQVNLAHTILHRSIAQQYTPAYNKDVNATKNNATQEPLGEKTVRTGRWYLRVYEEDDMYQLKFLDFFRCQQLVMYGRKVTGSPRRPEYQTFKTSTSVVLS